VFGEDVEATFSTDPKSRHVHRVRLGAGDENRRRAGLRASHEWFDATIFDLGVSATLFVYDDESDKEAALRELSTPMARSPYAAGANERPPRHGFATRMVVCGTSG
jgi:hypothetical protein